MTPRVLLVVMPFQSLRRPGLGVGLLKSGLARQALACDVRYFSFPFADAVGASVYDAITEETPTHDLVGEWIFGPALLGNAAPRTESFDAGIFARGTLTYSDSLKREIGRCRTLSRAFIEECADQVDTRLYDIVGFSTTFQQNIASLALARELKQRDSRVTIVLGGANCEGEMGIELHRSFDFVDVVCSGEADLVFPRLVRRLRAGESLESLPGVTYRADGRSVSSGAPAVPVEDLEALPYPDHADFLDAFRRSTAASITSPQLTIETSRGCWWGQKHHCTFCGLNGEGMAYRSKSPGRALAEIVYLLETYGIPSLFNTDNIVDMRYFAELFPRLTERGVTLQLCYETKANLRREQLAALRAMGTTWFQPGIESLNSHVLSLMNKGVKGIQNVQLLKWAEELGFDVCWNVLCGFPGEQPEDYEQTVRTMRAIPHLPPPAAISRFRLDRFSPMFMRPDQYGVTNIRPFPAYRQCYPLPEEALARVAYFFDCDVPMTNATAEAIQRTWNSVDDWRRVHPLGTLTARVEDDSIKVVDTRGGRAPETTLYSGVAREVYLAAASVRGVAHLLACAQKRAGPGFRAEDLAPILGEFVDRDLMLRENDLYLSLALMPETPSPQTEDMVVEDLREVSPQPRALIAGMRGGA